MVAVSIFVNPTQFGDAADLANYPRTLDSDLDVAASAGGSLVFAPTVTEMYPEPPGSSPATVAVPAFSGLWEGASRPGHFDGVATVVVKLLSATGRCRAYFGEKDFQQLAMVRRWPASSCCRPRWWGARPCGTPTAWPCPAGTSGCHRTSAPGAGPVPGPPGRCLPHPPRRGEPGRGGGADGPGGGRGARRHPGLRGGGARRRARTGVDLRHGPPVAPADRGRGGAGPADRQSRPPAGLRLRRDRLRRGTGRARRPGTRQRCRRPVGRRPAGRTHVGVGGTARGGRRRPPGRGADQGRAVPVGDPLGPGGRGRRARGRRGLDRPAPGRHARRRGRPVRHRRGAGAGRRGPGPGPRAHRHGRGVRPAARRGPGPGP